MKEQVLRNPETQNPNALRRKNMKATAFNSNVLQRLLALTMTVLVFGLTACSTSPAPSPSDLAEESVQGDEVKVGYYHFPGDEHPVLINYEVVDGYAVYQGDMVLGRADEIAAEPSGSLSTQAVGLKAQRNLWTNAVIPYMFDSGVILHPASVIEITEAIKHVEANTVIRFVPYNASKHKKFLRFTLGNDSGACSSGIGMPTGVDAHGNPTSEAREISLSIKIDEKGNKIPTLCGVSTLIHELGHTIGLKHEQARFDRDKHVEIIWGNIKGIPSNTDRYKHNFCKVNEYWNKSVSGENKCVSNGTTSYTDLGPYDYESIMHYRWNAFSKDGKITVLPKALYNNPIAGFEQASQMGHSKGLSAGDIAAINRMYSAFDAFQGNWNSSWGPIMLGGYAYSYTNGWGVTGIYPNYAGTLFFQDDDNMSTLTATTIPAQAATLKGYWSQVLPSSQRCTTSKLGSYYWGRVELNFDTDNLEFTGTWSYCNATPTITLSGDRIGAN